MTTLLPPEPERQLFLLAGVLLILTCSLAAAFAPAPRKLARSLYFLAVLVAGFLLVAFLYPWSRKLQFEADGNTLGRVIALGIFFGLLALFRLMSRFENPG